MKEEQSFEHLGYFLEFWVDNVFKGTKNIKEKDRDEVGYFGRVQSVAEEDIVLERNTIKTPKKLNKKQQEAIIWVTSKQFTYDQLYHRVQKYKSSQTTIRNKRKTRY